MFDALKFKEAGSNLKNYRLLNQGSFTEELFPLSKVNIFIGPNNSGKSRLLRELFIFFSTNQKSYDPNSLFFSEIDFGLVKYKQIEDAIEDVTEKAQELLSENVFSSMKSTIKSILSDIHRNSYNGKVFINDLAGIKEHLRSLFLNTGSEEYSPKVPVGVMVTRGVGEKEQQYDALTRDLIKNISDKINESIEILDKKVVYIPALRSLKDINSQSLKTRQQADYFSKEDLNYLDVFSGENIYNEIKDLLLGDNNEREKLKAFETFLSTVFYNNDKVELVARQFKDKEENKDLAKNYDLYIRIGSSKDYPIYNLGDGILATILLTFPLFKNADREGLFFIEEPELYLHPAFQRLIMEVFSGDYFPKSQIFLSTHSNHFLDFTIEGANNISVFTLQQNKGTKNNHQFTITNVLGPENHVLDLIGAKNSSVFLTNCTIWVEGITDRIICVNI
ncbi:MAG: ATP-dependent nuclease [Bacteroidia bacterium]